MTPKIFFYKTARFFNRIPLDFLIRITGQRFVFPFYHLVADYDVIHIKHLYKIKTSKEFESDLDFLLREYEPLSVVDLSNGIESVNKGRKGFILTFDDGLREFHDVAAPILLRKGIPAICFLNTGFIDNRDMFFRYKASILIENIRQKQLSDACRKKLTDLARRHQMKFDDQGNFIKQIHYSNSFLVDEFAEIMEVSFHGYLEKNQPYLTGNQIETLTRKGFSFGAHSIDHPMYSELPVDAQIRQTKTSIDEVLQRFAPEFRLFSFPFTDHGIPRDFFNYMYENKLVDFTFGCAGIKKDEFIRNIQRIPLETGTFNAREIILGEYLYYMFKALVHQNSIKRR